MFVRASRRRALLSALLNTVPDLTGVGSRGFVESVKSMLGGLARGRKVKKSGKAINSESHLYPMVTILRSKRVI